MPTRRRGSYQAICQPRGIFPPCPASLRNRKNMRDFMGVAPLDRRLPRARVEQPHHARRATIAAVSALRQKSFSAVAVLSVAADVTAPDTGDLIPDWEFDFALHLIGGCSGCE